MADKAVHFHLSGGEHPEEHFTVAHTGPGIIKAWCHCLGRNMGTDDLKASRIAEIVKIKFVSFSVNSACRVFPADAAS